MQETFCCTLAKGETRKTSYFIRYFRTCPKKYLRWMVPGWVVLWGFLSIMALGSLVVGNETFTLINFLRVFALTAISSLILGIFFIYLVQYRWRLSLYCAGVKTDCDLLVRVGEDQLALSADSKRYIIFIFSPDFKKHKETWAENERFGGYITDVYECESGIYFWLLVTPYPAAFLEKKTFSEAEYADLKKMLKNRFKGRYHDVSK